MDIPNVQGHPEPTRGGPGNSSRRKWVTVGICLVLLVLVGLIFGQTRHFDFVNYDDDRTVTHVPQVVAGLSFSGMVWAFTHPQVSCWAPLTTMTHMLDCQIHGLWPGGHHLSNLFLHGISAVLLYLLFQRMTANQWASAFLAIFFAIHPLRAESVAWISERKDCLSGVFFLLTLWAYARYATLGKSRSRYGWVLLWFALGLMSKPMLVTVPFVLLLLDYWPLGRAPQISEWPKLVREKWPLFVLSAILCVVTLISQKHAIASVDRIPLAVRLGNASVAYAVYLWKFIWPVHLAAFYPLSRQGPPVWQVLAASTILAILTLGAWRLRHRLPFLLVGWLWFLGMLVPVIGIIQVGGQAYADRYTYLPQIGLCFAIVWTVGGWVGEYPCRRRVVSAVAVVIAMIIAAAAHRQTGVWRDSRTLWVHAIEHTKRNDVALTNLGNVSLLEGHRDEALAGYQAAIEINPANIDARHNLAHVLFESGRTEDAIAQYRDALDRDPDAAQIHLDFGVDLFRLGQMMEAEAHFRQALRIDPKSSNAHLCLGNVFLVGEQIEPAVAEFHEAMLLNPADPLVRRNLAHGLKILFETGRIEPAISQIQEALRISPNDSVSEEALAWMLATAPQPEFRDGARALRLALRVDASTAGRSAETRRTLAAAYAETGDFANAIEMARYALELAISQNNNGVADALRKEIALYQVKSPIRNRAGDVTPAR